MEARRSSDPDIGPYRASDVRPGDPYEVSDGHLIECMGTGRRGSLGNATGAVVLHTDPDVKSAGVDLGVSPKETMLRAPDIAVGDIENEPGWATKAPPLAVEYADRGQDEVELKKKIKEFLQEGTRFVWVVRMTGPRRVEVHEPGKEMWLAKPGDELKAPGILRNPVPIEALYDAETAHHYALRNLLQRQGYDSLEDVKDKSMQDGLKEGRSEGLKEGRSEGLKEGRSEGLKEGRSEGLKEGRSEGLKEGRSEGLKEGRAEGQAEALLLLLKARGMAVPDEVRQRVLRCNDIDQLQRWIERAAVVSSIDAMFEK